MTAGEREGSARGEREPLRRPGDSPGDSPGDLPGDRGRTTPHTPRDVVQALLADYRFAGVAAVVRLLDLPASTVHRIEALAKTGERLLDLDAEDFDELAAREDLPPEVVEPVRAAQFPRRPGGQTRGSLRSLHPLYALMLEALDIRWLRREPVHVVVLLHLFAEYLPMLAWESVLGNSGDPRELIRFTSVQGSLWGHKERACDHTAAQRAAAHRMGQAMRGDEEGWTVYLDRFHSRVADALGRCASHPVSGRPMIDGVCRRPCGLWLQLSEPVREDLGARMHLARMYAESPVVALRHHAPVGHFFGVPAPSEIAQAWERSWQRLDRPWDSGDNPLHQSARSAGQGNGHVDEHRRGRSAHSTSGANPAISGQQAVNDLAEALPGIGRVLSAVAGRPVHAGGVLRTIRDSIAGQLLGD
ncbi:hypothetical protein [Flindersiella endophytica]